MNHIAKWANFNNNGARKMEFSLLKPVKGGGCNCIDYVEISKIFATKDGVSYLVALIDGV